MRFEGKLGYPCTLEKWVTQQPAYQMQIAKLCRDGFWAQHMFIPGHQIIHIERIGKAHAQQSSVQE